MSVSCNQESLSSPVHRRWLISIFIIAALIVGLLIFRFFHGWTTSRKEIQLAGENVAVVITEYYSRNLAAGHGDFHFETNYSYKVCLYFPEGRTITFAMRAKPEAIWSLGGQLFFIGRDWSLPRVWFIKKVCEDGQLVTVKKWDLPQGDRAWNLAESDDVEEAFKAWCYGTPTQDDQPGR